MKLQLCFIFLLSVISSNAFELYNPEFIEWCEQTRTAISQPYGPIISLGFYCQVASQLRIHGLRYEAFPFDWLVCHFEALIVLIENHFKDFLNPEYLQFVTTEKEKYILNAFYGIKFLHDFK